MGLSGPEQRRSLNKVIFIKNGDFHETTRRFPASNQIGMRNRYLIEATMLAGSLAFSQGPADQELWADALARQVLANEVKTQDDGHWMYQQSTTKARMRETAEVIESKAGTRLCVGPAT
jgi:hypothetical protein